MPFSNSVKQEAKRKAAFRCCICRKSDLSLEVHHIIPEGERGSDDISNAVLLCSSCHSNYGANAEKRRMIREMRDWWYETVEQMFSPASISMINDLYGKVDQVQQDQSNMSANVFELRNMLKNFMNHTIDEIDITPDTAGGTVSRFVNASGLVDASMNYQPPDHCEQCGYRFVSELPESNECPNCGAPITRIILHR